jgi:hypothetical protein
MDAAATAAVATVRQFRFDRAYFGPEGCGTLS